jgi:hypothetical protein
VVSEEAADGRRKLVVRLADDAALTPLLRALLDRGESIHSCDRIEPDLETAFSRILAAREDEP